MSRCYPYPPPARNDRDEALIESIKLQKEEKEKAKAERKKERKRQKKEKKRAEKEKAKQNLSEFGHGEKRKLNDEETKEKEDLKSYHFQKSREDEAEQLERSSLTEELEQPVCPPQNTTCSSDSTQNSDKRRRQLDPGTAIRAYGNVIRIRLPPQKQREPDALVSQERLPSTTTKNNSEIGFGPTRQELPSKKTDVRAGGLAPRFNNEQICSILAKENLPTTTGPTSYENGIPTLESLYKDLVEHWVPPFLQSEQTNVEEQEWLVRKHPNRERSKAKANSDVLCTGGSTWPCAWYLPEAEIYALPFAVPF